MAELLDQYLGKLSQLLGLTNASASAHPRPEAYHNSSSDQPSAYLDQEPAKSPLGQISVGPVTAIPHGRDMFRGKITPGQQSEMVAMEQSRQPLQPELKTGNAVRMAPIQMEKEATDYQQPDQFEHGDDIMSLLSDAESGAGVPQPDIRGHGSKEGKLYFQSPHAHDGKDMSEDEALEYIKFLSEGK